MSEAAFHHNTSLVPVPHQQGTSTFIFDGKPIRVSGTPEAPLFVAQDVCGVLGLGKHRDALSKLDADERGALQVDTLGGRQVVAAVTEGGMYTLILKCRTATTAGSVPHRFRRGVTSEVLPAIRRTGTYAAPAAPRAFAIDARDPAQISVIALQLLQVNQELVAENAQTKQALVVVENRAVTAEAVVEQQRPLVDAYHAFLDDEGLCGLATAAAAIEAPQTLFFAWVRERGFLFDRDGFLQARADLRRDGHFKLQTVPGAYHRMRSQTMVTRSGLNWLRQRWAVGPGRTLALQAAVAAKQASLPGI